MPERALDPRVRLNKNMPEDDNIDGDFSNSAHRMRHLTASPPRTTEPSGHTRARAAAGDLFTDSWSADDTAGAGEPYFIAVPKYRFATFFPTSPEVCA